MKKTILGIGIIILMLVIFVSGCTDSDDSKDEESDNGGTTGDTYTMTAKEYNDDIYALTRDADGTRYVTVDYTSLEDGDTLIIQDTITEILYDSVTDSTTVTFKWIEGEDTGSLNLPFEGNITGSYQVGYEVKVTVKIKHETFTFEVGEMLIDYDIEIFEEQWTTEEDYISSGGRSALPSTSIEKIV